MRYSPYEIARKFSNIALMLLLAARFLSSIVPAWNAQQAVLDNVVLVLCGARLVLLLVDLKRGRIAWQRAALPSIALLVVAAIFAGPESRMLAKIGAVAVEAGILALIIYAVAARGGEDDRAIEERLLEQMRMFVPSAIARVMVSEMLIVHAAFKAMFHRGKREHGGFGYVENSLFRILPLLILFCSPVDLLLIDVVLKILKVNDAIWTAVLAATDFYSLIWAYGALTTMRERPHRIGGTHLHVHKGIFGSAKMALASIQSATPQPKSENKDGCADLSLRGTSKVMLQLSKPADVVKWLAPALGPFLRVTVSADDPSALCRAIERARHAAN